MRHILFAAACTLGLAACSLDPPKMSTEMLCNRYSAPLSTQRNDPAVRDELLRRGAHSCVDPETAGTRGRNALIGGMFGPIAGAIHSAANPLPPIEGSAEHRQATDREIAKARREQAEQQRRETIASMVARGASDEEIRKALGGAPAN